MHLWHAAKLSPDLMEFVYAHKYHVTIPCTNYTPICPQVRVTMHTQAKLKERDSFPHFTALIVRTAQALISETQEKLNLKQVRRFRSLSAILRRALTRRGRSFSASATSGRRAHNCARSSRSSRSSIRSQWRLSSTIMSRST